jgi:hypothetical protein
MSSKNEELYLEVFYQLKKFISAHNKNFTLSGNKIMSDLELGMRKAIKASFELCKLQVCYFHFCKAIWNKIKKLHLFKKAYRVYYVNSFYYKSISIY